LQIQHPQMRFLARACGVEMSRFHLTGIISCINAKQSE
jgi:hypothetical protein